MLNEEVITKAKEKGIKMGFVAAGAGVGLFDLFRVPGCSVVMTEAQYLYDKTSYDKFFQHSYGYNPNEKVSFVTSDMATKLASVVMNRRTGSEEKLLTVGVTAAVKTNRVRRGADHGYVTVYLSGDKPIEKHIEIEGDTRDEQDQYLTDKVFEFILEVLDMT